MTGLSGVKHGPRLLLQRQPSCIGLKSYDACFVVQVVRLQRMWRNTVTVRVHQRQLLFMQLQRYAERHAARLVRTGAAFLSGATLSATSANATRKGDWPTHCRSCFPLHQESVVLSNYSNSCTQKVPFVFCHFPNIFNNAVYLLTLPHQIWIWPKTAIYQESILI